MAPNEKVSRPNQKSCTQKGMMLTIIIMMIIFNDKSNKNCLSICQGFKNDLIAMLSEFCNYLHLGIFHQDIIASTLINLQAL